MAERALRRKRRAWMMLVYLGLYLLTLTGTGSAGPRFWGIPLWYLGSGLVILLLIPANLFFVAYCWPQSGVETPKGEPDV